MARQPGQMLAVNGIGVVEARKEELKQIFANRGNGALGRQVCAVDVVDPASRGVRSQDRIGDEPQILVHFVASLWSAARRVATILSMPAELRVRADPVAGGSR